MDKRTAGGRVGAAAAASALVAGVLVVMTGSPAAAHVTVHPDEAEQGGFVRVDFRVPTESDTESTTELAVHFPEDPPIPTVLTAPVPGWSAEVERRTLDEPIEGGHGEQITEVVEAVTWTADSEDAQVAPGEFAEFPVSMGPMPEVDEVYFRALQTYSDGEVVRWIELPAADGDEPPLPAAALRLVPGDRSGDGSGPASGDPDAGAGSEPAGASEEETAAGGGEDAGGTAGVWLGLAGLVVGLAALALGGTAFLRTRATRARGDG